jgi:hypothetical protein
MFSTWFQTGFSRKRALQHPVELTYESIYNLLSAQRCRRDIDRSIIQELGATIAIWNAGDEGKSSGLILSCGVSEGPCINHCTISLPYDPGYFQATMSMDILLGIMQVMADMTDADFAHITTNMIILQLPINDQIISYGIAIYLKSLINCKVNYHDNISVVRHNGKGVIIQFANRLFGICDTEEISNMIESFEWLKEHDCFAGISIPINSGKGYNYSIRVREL